mmetsp:Transcript_26898/g.49823  ORF Transcript_26898/g.49823 Transcript_26898/m.49823 type:complete len:351 (-) Transcript_26898:1615-2667(-)
MALAKTPLPPSLPETPAGPSIKTSPLEKAAETLPLAAAEEESSAAAAKAPPPLSSPKPPAAPSSKSSPGEKAAVSTVVAATTISPPPEPPTASSASESGPVEEVPRSPSLPPPMSETEPGEKEAPAETSLVVAKAGEAASAFETKATSADATKTASEEDGTSIALAATDEVVADEVAEAGAAATNETASKEGGEEEATRVSALVTWERIGLESTEEEVSTMEKPGEASIEVTNDTGTSQFPAVSSTCSLDSSTRSPSLGGPRLRPLNEDSDTDPIAPESFIPPESFDIRTEEESEMICPSTRTHTFPQRTAVRAMTSFLLATTSPDPTDPLALPTELLTATPSVMHFGRE